MANEVDPVLNTISNDQYGFMQAFMKLAEKCFSQVPDTTETTKLGMFGYLTEIASHASKSSQFHRNMMYNEFFLNTAMMPTTIYNTAESEGVELKASRPSSCTIILEIEKTKLLSLIDSNESGWLTIDRDDFLVKLDTTDFRLPYSLIFSRNANGIRGLYKSVPITNGSITIPAETPLFDTVYNFQSNFSVPIKEYYDDTKKATMVSFSIVVFNVKFDYQEDVYADTSNSSISKYMIDFADKYVGATAFQRSNENDDWTPLKIITSSLKSAGSDPSVYLKRLDSDTVLFYFGRGERSYIPVNGMNLKFVVATTDGENGNFTFKGTPAISIDKVDYASEFSSWVFSSPAGGTDEDSLMTHKKDIYTNRTRAKLLGSETDLNEFFASTSVGNEKSKVLVFKERDDLITRQFNAFCLLSDDTCTYETNTIQSVIIPYQAGAVKKILPYMPIRYNLKHTEYVPGTNDAAFFKVGRVINEANPIQDIKECLLNRDEFIYFTPFSYYIKMLSNGTHSYIFDEHIDESYSVYIKTLTSESIDTPIVNYVKAKRNPALGGLISVYAYVSESELSRNRYFLMLRNSDDKLIAIELYRNDEEGCYECGLQTTGISEASLGTEVYKMDVITKGTNILYDTYDNNGRWAAIPGGTTFTNVTDAFIYCMEPIDENNLIDDNKGEYPELEGIKDSICRNLSSYRLKTISTISGGFKFFENFNDVMSVETSHPVDDPNVYLEMLPVVGGRMLFSNTVYESFMALFKSVIESIRAAAKRLHNNTRLNIKFFNTYGRTDFWKAQLLASSGETATERNLLKPNLYYEVIVDRQNGYDEEVEKSIASITRNWTEKLFDLIYNNVLITERISLSNLLKELETSITDCDSINIKSLNGIDHAKYIVPHEDYKDLLESETSSRDFVPSFPTVNLGVLNESRALQKENDISIQFVS